MALGIPGLRIGHWQDLAALTGVTVVLPPPGTLASVCVRGGAPGTHETDALAPHNLVNEVHAVVLTGGSAFGLAAAFGVQSWLEERGIGYRKFDNFVIPIVPAATIYDLGIGDGHVRPGPAEGRAACEAANEEDGPCGNVGAGAGATVGKVAGPDHRMKGGIGWALRRQGELAVGALVVTNAAGDVLDEQGRTLAGTRVPGGLSAMIGHFDQEAIGNTTNAVIVTNARLDKYGCHRVAVQAHDGFARAIRPVHTLRDGDAAFALASPAVEADVDMVCIVAEMAVEAAIRTAVRSAASVPGAPGLAD
ncbi:MAG: P1 family peptidase [Actinomycetota bacterium]